MTPVLQQKVTINGNDDKHANLGSEHSRIANYYKIKILHTYK